ncbi:probable fatty acyl-CoA reductase 4 [Typha latifolia]|uniref:probable fatty acyl-CoA reductase 4 n=1 Tax=Typha latifolia TaxID=4733 RepID=UPI003C2D1262
MEFGGVAEYLEDKSIFVTGSTGFIAKIFIEKVLRTQPKVKKLFLLVRAKDDASAKKRVDAEVMQMDVFQILREKYQEEFQSYFWSKVQPVAGDIASENMGINDRELTDALWKEIDVIVNLAADTSFLERYDVALSINTFGVKNVLEFAMKCVKLKKLLQVSTAYVTRENSGIILEEPVVKAIDGGPTLNAVEELKLAQAKLKELAEENASEDTIKYSMRDLGMTRAHYFGWPNTYTLTKAMGELLCYDLISRLPIVIFRPTMTISTCKEPFSGWIEGVRTIDELIASFAMGHTKGLPANVTTIVDLIPGDMVANAMIAVMTAHSGESSSAFIYQLGSSAHNPVTLEELSSVVYNYFLEKPYTNKDGSTIMVTKPYYISTMALFQLYMAIGYKVPLQAMRLVGLLHSGMRSRYDHLNRIYNRALRVAKAYKHFAFFHGRFDDHNMQKLMLSMKEKDRELIPIDTECIKWEEYMRSIHIPAVIKYGIKEKSK